MYSLQMLDAAGRLRSPAPCPATSRDGPPRNKGLHLPGRSTAGRGDHRRHAGGGDGRPWCTGPRSGYRFVACGGSTSRKESTVYRGRWLRQRFGIGLTITRQLGGKEFARPSKSG